MNGTFLFPSVCTFTGQVTASGSVLDNSAQLTVTNITGGNNLIYNPGASVTAGSFIAGVTYQITAIGTTDFHAIGAPTNYTVGTKFTAIGVGSGTGTAIVALESCLLNGPGLPQDAYLASQVSGTAGGNGVYTLDFIVTPRIKAGAAVPMTQGRHFTAATSAATSLPLAVDGLVATVVIHQNAADTGSCASNFVQGSLDGDSWVNLSSGLNLTTAAVAASYLSATSGNQTTITQYRILLGTVTGSCHVGGAIRTQFLTRN